MPARLLEGFAAGLAEYPDVRPLPENYATKSAYPVPGTDLERDKILTWDFTSQLNELIRFGEEFLTLKGKFTFQKAKRSKTDPDNPWEVLNPQMMLTKEGVEKEVSDRHSVFLHPALGGASLVKRIDVQLDKQYVENSPLNRHQALYTALERTFTTGEDFRKKYGRKMVRMSNTDDQKVGIKTSGDYVRMANTISGAHWDVVTKGYTSGDETQRLMNGILRESSKLMTQIQPSKMPDKMKDITATLVPSEGDDNSVTLKIGLSGLFPTDTQSNILRTIAGIKLATPYLHPGVNVGINVEMRDPIDVAIESNFHSGYEQHNFVTKAATSGHAEVSDHLAPGGTVRFQLTEASIQYDSLTLAEGNELSAVRSTIHNYLPDSAMVQQRVLGSISVRDTQTFRLQPGTKAAILAFQHQDFTYGLRGRPISPRSTFVPGLEDLTVHLANDTGTHQLLALKHPGSPKGFTSRSLREYHAGLVRRGLYDAPFEDWFPAQDGNIGLEQAIVLDLTPFNIRENVQLILGLSYEGASGPEKHNVICFTLFQRPISYNSSTAEWVLTPAAPMA